MLYLMTVLTFLAGILFYLMSPSDDTAQMDTYRAQPMIQGLLNQHQAAKNYLRRWFGIYRGESAADATPTYFNLPIDFYEYNSSIMTNNQTDMCLNSQATEFNGPMDDADGHCFVSRVVCIKPVTGAPAENCYDPDSEVYVVTYGGWDKDTSNNFVRPDWWPKQQRYRLNERWRSSIAQRTHGSMTCGTLTQSDLDGTRKWCIDNGKRVTKIDKNTEKEVCVREVPRGVIENILKGADDVIGDAYVDCLSAPASNRTCGFLYDMLFCMSEVKQGTSNYYPNELKHFWDGLDNLGMHAPTTQDQKTRSGPEGTGGQFPHNNGDPSAVWKDLQGNAEAGNYDTAGNSFSAMGDFDNPGINLSTNNAHMSFDIPGSILAGDFTLTVLAQFLKVNDSSRATDFDLIHFENGNNHFVVKFKNATTGDKLPEFVLQIQNGSGSEFKFTGKYIQEEKGLIGTAHSSQLVTVLTVRRKGNELNMYFGSDPKGDEAQKNLFNGTLDGEALRLMNQGFNNPTTKMYMHQNTDGATVKIHGVRHYGRALEIDEIYRAYKEDARRYPVEPAIRASNAQSDPINWDGTTDQIIDRAK